MFNFLQSVGCGFIHFIERVGASTILFARILWRVPRHLRYWYMVIEQVYFIGILSLPIILISGAFIGMVVTLQGFHTLNDFGAQSELSRLLALSVFRELGPVMTALLFAGRAGSAVTAEVGLMRVSEQLTSMEVMAVDPIQYVAFPRWLAGIIAMPLLAVLFCGVAIFAGYWVSVVWLGIDAGTFMSVMKSGVDFNSDVMQGLIKSFVFGVVVVHIALFQGFSTEVTSGGLGKSATKTVVYSSLAILGIDFILTALLLGV